MRRARQVALADSLTSRRSLGVVGWCSAWSEWRRALKSALLSPGRISVLAVSPCFRLFQRTAARPLAVFGPVLFLAFRRLARICLAVAIIGTLAPKVADGS